ncbi:MAG: hypothetical protein E6K91_08170, partial [Thaumarchaeota archaeon]
MKTKIISFSLFFIFAISFFTFPNVNSMEMNYHDNTQMPGISVNEKFVQPNVNSQAKHLTISLSENVGITTNDQKNDGNKFSSAEPKSDNSKRVDLSDSIKIEMSNLDKGTVVVLGQATNQLATMERISNADRIRFNGKTFVVQNILANEPTANKLSNFIGYKESYQSTLSNGLTSNFESMLGKVILTGSNSEGYGISNILQVFSKDVESLTNPLMSLAESSANPKNPTILVLLVPLSGYLLFRAEGGKFEFSRGREILSFCFIALLIASTIATPLSISSHYWGEAFAEGETNSTVSVPTNSTVSVPTNSTVSVPTNSTVSVPTNST